MFLGKQANLEFFRCELDNNARGPGLQYLVRNQGVSPQIIYPQVLRTQLMLRNYAGQAASTDLLSLTITFTDMTIYALPDPLISFPMTTQAWDRIDAFTP